MVRITLTLLNLETPERLELHDSDMALLGGRRVGGLTNVRKGAVAHSANATYEFHNDSLAEVLKRWFGPCSSFHFVERAQSPPAGDASRPTGQGRPC